MFKSVSALLQIASSAIVQIAHKSQRRDAGREPLSKGATGTRRLRAYSVDSVCCNATCLCHVNVQRERFGPLAMVE